jgi:hypothetical protein
MAGKKGDTNPVAAALNPVAAAHLAVLKHIVGISSVDMVNKDQQGEIAAGDVVKLFLEQQDVTSMATLMSMEPEDFKTQFFLNKDGDTVNLSVGHAINLINLKYWGEHLHTQKDAVLEVSEWLALTRQDYQKFTVLTLPRLKRMQYNVKPSQRSAGSDFSRSIKRDKTQYTKLLKEEDFDQWNRSFRTTIRTQELDPLIKADFKPTTPDEIELWPMQQKFGYSVFEWALQTDTGKDLVRQYEDSFDAQALYRDLVTFHRESTAASLNAGDLLEYLTNTKYDSNWSLGAKQFVLHWLNQMRMYNVLKTKPEDKISEGVKLSLLQSAVAPIDDLRNVRTTAETLATQNGSDVSFSAYRNLLLSATMSYDKEAKNSGMRARRNRFKAHETQLSEYDDSYLLDDTFNTSDDFFDPGTLNTSYNEDNIMDLSPHAFLQLNVHNRTRSANNPRTPARAGPPRGERQSMYIPPAVWNLLDEKARTTIREGRAQGSTTPNTPPSNMQSTPRHVSQTRMVAFDDPPLQETMLPSVNTPTRQITQVRHDVSTHEDPLLTLATGRPPAHPGDIRRILAANQTPTSRDETPPVTDDNLLMVNGRQYRAYQCRIIYHMITYTLMKQALQKLASLIDRGANGGLAGGDVRVLERSDRRVSITGIDNHQITGLHIVTCAGTTISHRGPIVLIMHQYAYLGHGKTIHSCGQLEHYKIEVHDRSANVGGLQRIITLEGHHIPLQLRDGLAYMDMSKTTDDDLENLEHVVLTSDVDWDPSVLDSEIDVNNWDSNTTTVGNDLRPFSDRRFHGDGSYARRHVATLSQLWTDDQADIYTDADFYSEPDKEHESWELPEPLTVIKVNELATISPLNRILPSPDRSTATEEDAFYDCLLDDEYEFHFFDSVPSNLHLDPIHINNTNATPLEITSGQHTTLKSEPDYEKLRPLLGFAPLSVIKETFQRTTQFFRNVTERTPMRRHLKSRFPALNVQRRNEPVATDTVYSDTPAVDDGSTSAQIFIGRESFVADCYGMKSDKEFVNTLEDQIRRRGAMDKLISDRAQVEISKKVQDILRAYRIADWQSEPYHQNQNFFERKYGTIKEYTNNIMNRVGAPAYTWLLCLVYVCALLNHLSSPTLGGATPLTALTGQLYDISVFLQFHFWEPVYFKTRDNNFPSSSGERLGWWVGIHEHCGDALTYKVLAQDTMKLIPVSTIRSAAKDGAHNLRLDTAGGEILDPRPIVFIKDRHGDTGDPDGFKSTPGFDPSSLLGRTFLKNPEDNGEQFRARVTRKIIDSTDEVVNDRVKFLIKVDGQEADEIITYNELVDHLCAQFESEEPAEDIFNFKSIKGHQGPLISGDPAYKGSRYNVMVEWETGETTYEPLELIAKDDAVTCALYAKDNGLLNTPGWKRFQKLAKRNKKFIRSVNQSKLRQTRRSPKFKFGFEVPRNHLDAIRLDELSGNTLWRDSEILELTQIDEFDTFHDKGKAIYDSTGKVSNGPTGYHKIRVHMIYDIKHDGRHKSRLVADGHLTSVPAESVYSGVVSLRSLRLTTFLSELNQLELWGADISNAYLFSESKEKNYIIGGPEFGDRKGHILIIHKALYGLRTSGLCWHEKFAKTLTDMGFTPSKADSDVWMRAAKDYYEYVAVYVDDLALALKDPGKLIAELENVHGYRLKGVGKISYHLGLNFERDKDGTLRTIPRKYITKMMDNYERMFGGPPKEASSPLEKGDHPELDNSPLCNNDEIKQYQSMIGALQWLVSIGRFDIFTAVMSMSRWRVAPRIGHRDRLKRIYGYVKRMKDGSIRIRTQEPDYSDLPELHYSWANTVYGNVKELLPKDAPPPLGKRVVLTTYVDANLYHDVITGRSVTALLHFINQTPFDWYTKRQATVETATFGSEFVAARTGVEQIMDIRTSLRYLGVPICGKTIMFGDNQSVVISSTIPHSELKKRHIALSYHRTREAIAAGIVAFYHISSVSNPADLLSKHWGFQTAWPLLKPLLFWMGDTAKIPDGVSTKAKTPLSRTKGECNETGSQPSLVSHACKSKRD